ncbi:hypothetical protein BH10PSE12_BH10PSE12_14520 [soil metagenome]
MYHFIKAAEHGAESQMEDAMQSGMEIRAGYRGTRTSPIGIGGAVAVHAVVVGIVLLMPAQIIERFTPPIMWTRNIALPKPPPEQPRVADPVRTNPIPERVESTVPDKPLVDLPTDVGIDLTGGTTFPGDGLGAGTGTVIEPTRAPVLADALPDPRFASDFQPDYPASMQRAQEEGKVTVRLRIGPDGRVLAVEKLFATTEAFWEVTQRQALRKWRFRPATRDGVPVEGVRTMTVHFRLDD